MTVALNIILMAVVVLIAKGLAAAGVCHSDVHLQDGHVDLGDGDKLDWSRGRTLPHTLGHEIEGTLSAVGPGTLPLNRSEAVGNIVDGAPIAIGFFPLTRPGEPRVDGYSMTGLDLLYRWDFHRR